MTNSALNIAKQNGGARQTVRFPVLPGRAPAASAFDTTCEAYKAGHRDASIQYAEEKAKLERSHNAFVDSVGEMLSEMEARYREEALSLVGRLFAAVAPSLARKDALSEIVSLVQERITRSDDELKLHVHPDLIAHLADKDRKTLNENPSIVLELDETCSPSSIDARWSKGGFISDPDRLIREILNTLGCDVERQEESGDE